jgi:ribosomal protein S18 acetylase RimI-like enzyme
MCPEKEHQPQFMIREATLDDASRIREMQAKSWLATYPNDDNGVSYEWVKDRTDKWLLPERIEESRAIFEKIVNDETQFYRLAEKEGEVVGFVHVSTKGDDTKELDAIYTDPKTFGSGLGKQLIKLADEWIGRTTTTLQVATYNERAIRFYKKHGFKIVEDSENLYADKIPVISMIRQEDRYEI